MKEQLLCIFFFMTMIPALAKKSFQKNHFVGAKHIFQFYFVDYKVQKEASKQRWAKVK